MRKREALTKSAAALHSNIGRMDKCHSEFAEMMQNCINDLTVHRSRWLQQLQTEKEEFALEIERAVGETTRCLDQGGEPVSPLGRAMWTSSSEMFRGVFSYEVNAPDLRMLCEDWAH